MISSQRDILVLLRIDSISDQELRSLHRLLKFAESPRHFCIAHELADRNRIHSRPQKLLKESARPRLRPFRFLINKN